MFNKNKNLRPGPNDIEQPVDRHLMFAVYDEKAAVYSVPFAHPTVNVAIRSFTGACNRKESMLNQFPSDYALYHVGTYDERTAQLVSFPEPRFVIRASEIVNQLNLESKPQEFSHAATESH